MDKRKRESVDSGDPRTPMAWQHRDKKYHETGGLVPANSFRERYPVGTVSSSDKLSSHRSAGSRQTVSTRPLLQTNMGRNAEPPLPYRTPSVSPPKDQRSTDETSTGTVSDTESEPATRKGPSRPETRGTMRSMASMPLLAPVAPTPYGQMIYGPPPTWDGEPCPVHGASSLPPVPHMPMYHNPPFAPTPYPPMYHPQMAMRRAASIHDFNLYGPGPYGGPYMPYPLPTPGGTRAPSVRGSVIMMPHKAPSLPPIPPPNLLPPLQRPRGPQVDKSEKEQPPLPPKRPPPSVISKKPQPQLISYKNCCKGNVLVLWSILAVIAFGVVLGIVLSYTVR